MKMKMKIRHIILAALATASLTDCTNVLDKSDPSAVTSERTWNDPILAQAFLDKCYLEALPTWNTNINKYSEECKGGDEFLYGTLTYEGGEGPTSDIIEDRYKDLYKINTLLANIDTGTLSQDARDSMRAQAQFLRAWVYYQLVIRYGGMPLILEPQQRSMAEVPRAKTSECITQILKDLDDAADILPAKWDDNNYGRITRGAALALKGRVSLFYASKQFNRNNDKSRWQAAYDANLKAYEQLKMDGYGLNPKFADIWANETSLETVFTSRYAYPARTSNAQASIRPLEYSQGSAGGNQPTLDAVLMFPMADGTEPGVMVDGVKKPFQADATDETGLLWVGRDPRFYESIVTNGMLYELNGNTWPEKRQFTYEGGQISGANPTETGFYSCKFIQKEWDKFDAANCGLDWIEIRFAEVMLNLAESAAELGGEDDLVYDLLKQIRQRAGITPNADELYGLKANLTGEELVEAVVFEKRIEFAFEGKRFWDMRRRMMFSRPEYKGYTRYRIQISLTDAYKNYDREKLIPMFCEGGGESKLTTLEYFNWFKTRIVPLDDKYQWNVQDNAYFYALPKKHLERNPLLEQTQGWNDGTFDPLL